MRYSILDIPTEIILKINREFKSVHDLSWTLIDLQALIVGFLYGVDDTFLSKSNIVAEELSEESKTDEIVKRISNIIELDEYRKRQLSYEIEDVLEPETALAKREITTIRKYPSVTRNITGRYKDSFILRSFQQGSLILELTSTILGGLLLEFFRRLFFKDMEQSNSVNINIYDQKVIIYKDGNISRVNDELFKNITPTNDDTVIEKLSTKKYIDSVLNKVRIDTNDIPSSVKSLLHEMREENLITDRMTYNQKAIKTISTDITRLKGSFIDYKS